MVKVTFTEVISSAKLDPLETRTIRSLGSKDYIKKMKKKANSVLLSLFMTSN